MVELTRGAAARVGEDLSRRVFQVHAVDRWGHKVVAKAGRQSDSSRGEPSSRRLPRGNGGVRISTCPGCGVTLRGGTRSGCAAGWEQVGVNHGSVGLVMGV
jgi:hypothetical protein